MPHLQDRFINHVLNIAQSILGFLAGTDSSLQGKRQSLADTFESLIDEARYHLENISTSFLEIVSQFVLLAYSGNHENLLNFLGDVFQNFFNALGLNNPIILLVSDLNNSIKNIVMDTLQDIVGTLYGINSIIQG